MVLKQTLVTAALALFLMLALAATTLAATTYEGSASVSGGTLTLSSNTSDGDTGNDYGVATFDVPSGTTFATLTSLGADVNITDDTCAGGSPRFQIKVDTGSGLKNIFAYIGPEPSYTGCSTGTVSTGDLLTSGRAIDTSQVGGTFYDTYENAVEDYGAYPVVSVSLVVDAGWASGDGEQTITFDNVDIDGTIYDFEPPPPPAGPVTKDDCKKNGWKTFTNPAFKNQGQCVSYVNHQ